MADTTPIKVIGINGSPRQGWNTHTLIGEALAGAASRGAETELVNLYELDYKGCVSCFGCKLKHSEQYGHCIRQDQLTGVLDRLASADAIVLGTPIYFSNATGEFRSFLERLIFPRTEYTQHQSLKKHKARFLMIYTMNVQEDQLKMLNLESVFQQFERMLQNYGERVTQFACCDTYQFSDYDNYISDRFDPQLKQQAKDQQFPLDCQTVFNLGKNLV